MPRTPGPPRRDEFVEAGVFGDEWVAEDAVRDDQMIEFGFGGGTRADLADSQGPSSGRLVQVGGFHRVTEPDQAFQIEPAGVVVQIGLDLLAGGPFGILVGHREVREPVRPFVVLGGHPGIPPGAAPYPADVGGGGFEHRDIESELGE